MEKTQYTPIIIESLIFGKNSDYPLYIKSGENYILYRSKALIFSQSDALRLKNNGVDNLYIETKDKDKYDNDILEHIETIIKSPDTNFEEKAVKIYIYSKVYAEYVITTGNLRDNQENVKKSIETTIEYLLMSEFGFMNLLNLSGYDYNEVGHGMNVSIYSMALANRLGFSNKISLYEVGLAGLTHDIGKLKIPKELLSKKGLSESEVNEIRKHPIYSKEILTANGIDNRNVINGVLEHHEASNGSGYPFGKMEEDISAYGKILIIANRFDSLTRNRPYRIKLSVSDALNLMEQNSELYNTAFLREFILLMYKKAVS
ncbi:MAG: HD domain-containing protein [Deltaproteobacteria bacterium]|jgi:HD-GYP domain-containing protein (c-di-GMP phosphodiesterase class II)|nr:HD domain-containing protein [Deltaproteobacteria bacterium]